MNPSPVLHFIYKNATETYRCQSFKGSEALFLGSRGFLERFVFLYELVDFIDCMAQLPAEQVWFLCYQPRFRHCGVSSKLVHLKNCQ